MKKYYVISFENGITRYEDFNSYSDANNYASSHNGGYDYTIEEYNSEQDYWDNL